MSKKKQNQKSTSPKKAQQKVPAASSRSGQQTATKRTRGMSAATSSPTAVVHDPRLPKVGTVVRKLDRDGKIRCKCRIVQQGVRYNGSLYRSLSGAASAAATDLGLDSHQNGFVFWGLVN